MTIHIPPLHHSIVMPSLSRLTQVSPLLYLPPSLPVHCSLHWSLVTVHCSLCTALVTGRWSLFTAPCSLVTAECYATQRARAWACACACGLRPDGSVALTSARLSHS